MIQTQLFDLTGRVAVVSGGASGMGRSIAIAIAEHGADVMIADFNAEGARRTAERIEAIGRKGIAVECDVSNPEAIAALFARLDRDFGRVDFLANVAGDGMTANPAEMTLDVVMRVFQNLVFGRFVMCQEAGRRMLKQERGSILNIGSLASVTALGRGHVAYSMAMGAVAQLTRELSTEWARRGVRVNAILPAQVLNPGLEARIAADPSLKAKYLSGIPRGRLGAPDDIQGLAVLLASDASSWISGALIPMDGGNLALNAGGTIG